VQFIEDQEDWMMARKGRKSNRGQETTEGRKQREDETESRISRQNDDDQVEVLRLDPENEEELYGPEGETSLSFQIIDADINEEKVMDEIDDFTEDEEVLQDFSERQQMINEGSDLLGEKLDQYHFLSPDLSGDDIDAAWEDSTISGEESVGGSAPTPDQDIVDELGEALGIEYKDFEPLHTGEKLEARDLDRWELNPASVEEIEEQEEELAEQDEDETALYLEGDYEVKMLADEAVDDQDLDADEEDDEEDLEEDILADDIEDDDLDEFDLDDDDLDDFLDELEVDD
jgi:hypothetical protein